MHTSNSKNVTQRLLSNSQLFLDIALVVLGAYFITCVVIPERMDGDIIVPSIAALNNPTLFYWGQDRLLALTTFLLIPIRDIQLSLFLNTFLQATYFCGLTLLITKYASGKYISRALGYCLSILTFYWLIPQTELFTFAKHQQPYCAATFAALLSFRTFRSHRPIIQTKSFSNFFVASFLSSIALLLNPLSLVLLISQPVSAGLVNRKYNKLYSQINVSSMKHWLLSLAIAISSYLIIKNVYTQNYDVSSTNSELSLSRLPHALKAVSEGFWSSFNGNILTLTILMASILACLARLVVMLLKNAKSRSKAMNAKKQLLDHNFIFLSVTFNLISLIPILSSRWLELNAYALRYIYPVYLLLIAGIILLLCGLTDKLISNSKSNDFLVHIFLVSPVVAFFIGSLRPLPALTSYQEISAIVPSYNTISTSTYNNLLVAGSYWKTWPLKAYALKQGQNLPVLADRSTFDPISKQASKELQSKIINRLPFSYLCIAEGNDQSPCRQQFLNQVFEESGLNPKKVSANAGWLLDRELLTAYYPKDSDLISLIRFKFMPSSGIPNALLYTSPDFELSKDPENRLYFRAVSDNNQNKNWILLTREGKPIPAERGDYEINKIVDVGGYLEITDSNAQEKIEYIWIVDKSTGIFISQTLKVIEKP